MSRRTLSRHASRCNRDDRRKPRRGRTLLSDVLYNETDGGISITEILIEGGLHEVTLASGVLRYDSLRIAPVNARRIAEALVAAADAAEARELAA